MREGTTLHDSADGNPILATIVRVAQALGLKLHFERVVQVPRSSAEDFRWYY